MRILPGRNAYSLYKDNSVGTQDTSFLATKKLVYSTGVPVAFSIYEGIAETMYMLDSSVAFSSICSPGMYRTLTDYVCGLGDDIVIVDDVLGLCTMVIEGKTAEYPTLEPGIIQKLMSLNRITWPCPHANVPVRIPSGGVVFVATPLAYLCSRRLNEINLEVINENQETTFVLPVGEGSKAGAATTFFNTYLKQDVYTVTLPGAYVDDTWIIVPGKNSKKPEQVHGVFPTFVKKPPMSNFPLLRGDGNERKLYDFLYG